MQIKVINETNKTVQIFQCAKVKHRALAWLCDVFLLAIVLVVIFLITQAFSDNRFLLFLVLSCSQTILWTVYFIFLPFFWDGKTLFRNLLKIKLFAFDKRFLRIMIHELFLWILLSVLFLVIASYFFINQNSSEALNFFTNLDKPNAIAITIRTITILISFLQLIFIGYFCFSSEKQALQEILSNTFMVQEKHTLKSKPTSLKTNNQPDPANLPGVIALDEVEKFIN
ncbi:RDD family protein [Mycoplasmoides genitalium]